MSDGSQKPIGQPVRTFEHMGVTMTSGAETEPGQNLNIDRAQLMALTNSARKDQDPE